MVTAASNMARIKVRARFRLRPVTGKKLNFILRRANLSNSQFSVRNVIRSVVSKVSGQFSHRFSFRSSARGVTRSNTMTRRRNDRVQVRYLMKFIYERISSVECSVITSLLHLEPSERIERMCMSTRSFCSDRTVHFQLAFTNQNCFRISMYLYFAVVGMGK